MRVLLLGGTGNLGSRCIPALLAHNHTVVAYIRNPSKLKSMMSPAVIAQLLIVVGDATDSAAIAAALRTHAIEGIIDVAGNQVLPWREYLLPKIAKAACDAAVTVGRERGRPLRAWVTAGLGLMRPRVEDECMIQEGTGLRPAFAQHNATREVVESIPLADLRWSLFCVAWMYPVDSRQTVLGLLDEPRHHDLQLGKGALPDWVDSWWVMVPLVGKCINLWAVMIQQYSTKLEDMADFLAEDLGKETADLVGLRVGMKEKPKSKDD